MMKIELSRVQRVESMLLSGLLVCGGGVLPHFLFRACTHAIPSRGAKLVAFLHFISFFFIVLTSEVLWVIHGF